ncbi:PLxRFG domain-containing protein [Cypionkella sp.]|uniref:PLxRFG domain-containing protein n=1 Tax=Cypionkella sp. TaxID=2811411 RepID=UPI00271C8D0D|nr:PLxRFG domain-containing protein [Cypionkella sp.]MDO8983009.1 PLxRFG domain-containing protein [Cypionkella sp.]
MAEGMFGFGAMGSMPDQAKPDPAQRRRLIEASASQHQVPANVLMALDESGISDFDTAAQKIAADMKGGKTVDQIVGTDLMSRAYDIADKIYPRQPEPVATDRPKDANILRDTFGALSVGASDGLSMGVEYLGSLSDRAIFEPFTEGALGRKVPIAAPVAKVIAGWLGDEGLSGYLDESLISQAALDSERDFMPTGDITDFSTIEWGKDPSIRGAVTAGARVLGTMAPIIAASLLSKSPALTGAAVGGLMAGGDGQRLAEDTIEAKWAEKMPDGRSVLESETPLFQKYISENMTPEQAKDRIKADAMAWAGDMQAIVGAFGGAATGKIAHGALGRAAGGGMVRRAAVSGIGSAAEEGAQEVVEGISAREGINIGAGTNISTTAESFPNLVLGAMGGGPFGAVAGAANRPAGQPVTQPPLTTPNSQPLGDGSAGGQEAAPAMGLPGPDAGAASANMPPAAPAPMADDGLTAATIAAPTGPIGRAAALAPDLTPQPEAVPPPSFFPDQKPGSAIKLYDPEGEVTHNAVFLGEGPDGVSVRVNGEEIVLDPQEFDQARNEALRLEEEAKAAAKGAGKKAPQKQAEVPALAPESELSVGHVDDAAPEALREMGYYDGPWNEDATAPPAQPTDAVTGKQDVTQNVSPPSPEPVAANGGGVAGSGAVAQQGAGQGLDGGNASPARDAGVSGGDADIPAAGTGSEQPSALTAPRAPVAPMLDDGLAADHVTKADDDAERAQADAEQEAAITKAEADMRDVVMPDKALASKPVADSTKADPASKEQARREWGQFLPIAANGKSAWDGEVAGRNVLVRPGKVVVRAKPDGPSDFDRVIDTKGMSEDDIAAATQGAMNELDKIAPVAESEPVDQVVKPSAKPKQSQIGVNAEGNPLFEDADGVRSYRQNGNRVVEPLVKVNGENRWQPKADRGAGFKTEVERSVADPVKPNEETVDAPLAKPHTPAPPAKPKLSPKAARTAHDAQIDAHFTPGNIVSAYGGGHDRVVAFERDKDGGPKVTVESVVKQGDKWVKNPSDMRVRSHGTTPSERELRAGPVDREQQQTVAKEPTPAPTAAEIDTAAAEADKNPTDAQKEAGNYKMAHAAWNGLDITIETPKGALRKGKDADGNEWSVKLPAHYGYLKRTEGADGDHLDVYMGDNPDSDVVVVVDQVDADTKKFDETKSMLGFTNRKTALDFYVQGFSDGKGADRMGAHKVMTVAEFKDWVANGDTTKPVRLEGAAVAPAKPAGKIADFGEKLDGAAKDRWKGFAKRLGDVPDGDVANHPLSKSWPEPNYAALIEDGADPWSVAFIRAARQHVPRKPQGWKLKGWVEAVKLLRTFSRSLLDGVIDPQGIRDRLEQPSMSRLRDDIMGAVDLYLALGHDRDLTGIKLQHSTPYLSDGKMTQARYEVIGPGARNWPKVLAFGATKEAAIQAFKATGTDTTAETAKAKKGPEFLIYSAKPKGGEAYVFIGVKVAGKPVEVQRFATSQEARAYRTNNRADLEKRLAAMKEVPSERRDTNSERIGDDHRLGADVTPEAFEQTFGFRGVQFGNYVEGARRQQDLNQAYDALMDLAGIIGIPPKALSLNGQMGLAFGARGRGGKTPAKAHYESGNIVINLTKDKGAGSLAHEWFHAVDNYFERMRGRPVEFVTNNPAPRKTGEAADVRPEVLQAFADLREALRTTKLKPRSAVIDKMRSTPYWSTGVEMHARAFESYVIAKLRDQNAANDYLANIVSEEYWKAAAALQGLEGDSYPYLIADEEPAVRAAFDKLFTVIETRETDRGVEMYSRFPDGQEPADMDSAFAAEIMAELASVDDLFQNPTAQGTSIKAVFGEVDPSVTYVGDVATQGEASAFSERAEKLGAEKMHLLRTGGQDFFVYEGDGNVWMDVSNMTEGGAGSAVYSAVADYAYNSGQVFIGDPEGLSDIALRRRTEAMLSSALKHGTTKHLEPHERQIKGDAALGVTPLVWTDGDTVGNVESLIDVSVENLIHHVPEVADARYDFATGTFRDGEGESIADGRFRAWSTTAGARAAGAGRKTLKRGILLNTLAHTPSGKRPGLLERSLQQSDKLVARGLGKIFYSRGDVANSKPIPVSSLLAISESIAAEVKSAGLAGKVSPILVRRLLDRNGIPIQGRQAGAQIEISADSADPVGVMRHEIVHALRDESLWSKPYGLFTGVEWRTLVAAARGDVEIMARVEKAYSDKSPAVQTEEAVAEMYREWAGARAAAGPVSRIFNKVAAFFRAFASALRGEGFTDAAMVMERIAGGKVGGRGQDGGADIGPKPDASPDAAASDEKEMRNPLIAVQDKFKGLVGSRHWKNPGEWVSNIVTDKMVGDNGYNALSLVPGRALFAELGKYLPAAKAYLRQKEEMDSVRNEWHARADAVAQRWLAAQNKNPDASSKMSDLMHSSTLSGIDPSEPDTWVHAMDARARREIAENGDKASDWAKDAMREIEAHEGSYAKLRAEYKALPLEFRQLYRTVKSGYDAMGQASEKAILQNIQNATKIGLKRAVRTHEKEIARIRDEGLEGVERDEAIAAADAKLKAVKMRGGFSARARLAALRKKFELNRLLGPYFPLARFGNYFVTVRNSVGAVISFSKFEKESQQQAFIREMKEKGETKIEHGTMDDAQKLRGQIDPSFVADIENMLAESGASDEVMDAVWQHWLGTLPDMSIRTSSIHRKGRAGYSADAFRAFSNQMFHGGHQLAKLEHGLLMEEHLNDATEQAKVADNPNRALQVVAEMKKRHDFTMNPKGNRYVAYMSNAAFIWYLGATPAAALANITQTTVVGIPLMSARFGKAGVVGVTKALGKASKDFVAGRGKVSKRVAGVPVWTDQWTAENSPNLTTEEKAALAEAVRRGTIDKTQAHDLASAAEHGIEYNARREKWMKRIGFFFHHAERFNREVTFLASYRLAKAEGLDHAAAVDAAGDLTFKIHFDMQNNSRPRFMQDNMGKALTTFRQFTVNMLWRLFRDTHQMLNGATKEDRREARLQLVGLTLSMMAHAGIRGVWGYGLLMMLMGMLAPGADDDDIKEWLQEALLMQGDSAGVAAWNFTMGAVLNGVPGQILGVDLTDRIGMPNLWWRDAPNDLEGADLYTHQVMNLLGPAVSIGAGAARGVQLAADGEWWRGTEAAVPKVIRDGMKSVRYVGDGVNTLKGDSLIEGVSPYQAIVQAIGFTPAEIAERYDINSRLKDREMQVTDERSGIQKAAAKAILAGDGIPADILAQIGDFNSRYPEYPITGESIKLSARSKMRASDRSEFGIILNPRLNDRLRAERATPIGR